MTFPLQGVPQGQRIIVMVDQTPYIQLPVFDFERLQATNRKLHEEKEALMKENRELLLQYKDQSGRIDTIVKDNEKLRIDCQSLHSENESLRSQITLLRKENDDLRLQMNVVNKKLDDLQRDVSKISLREAMRVLEKYYVLDILGPKKQMKVCNTVRKYILLYIYFIGQKNLFCWPTS
jgi:predicted RNase H-like nuclease (RuvC/YqgF family)